MYIYILFQTIFNINSLRYRTSIPIYIYIVYMYTWIKLLSDLFCTLRIAKIGNFYNTIDRFVTIYCFSFFSSRKENLNIKY